MLKPIKVTSFPKQSSLLSFVLYYTCIGNLFFNKQSFVIIKGEMIMTPKTLSFVKREKLNKTENIRLRRTGKIPAIIYGHADTEPKPIYIDAKEFGIKFKNFSESDIIDLQSDSKEIHSVLIKDFQEDLIKERFVHIDFYEIDKNKVLRTKVHIHLTGNPEGVKLGGILETLAHEIEIECLPKDLPHELSVDVSALNIGDSIRVENLALPAGVKAITSSRQAICTVVKKQAEVAPAAAETAEAATPAATDSKDKKEEA